LSAELMALALRAYGAHLMTFFLSRSYFSIKNLKCIAVI